MVQLKLYLFGPPRLERAGQPVEINLRKALALMVYLAVTRQTHSRDALATLFWPDSSQRHARASLRRALHQLNQHLRQALAVTAETVAVDPQAELWLDIEVYRRHAAACGTEAGLSPACLARLAEAAALYTADFLAGFTLPDCPDFDEWQFFQAEALRQSLAQILAHLSQAHQARAEFEPAIRYARRWVSLEPLHEPAQRQLMQLYDQAGQPPAALRQYQEYARLLEEALGLPPSAETKTLYEAIKARHWLAPFMTPAGEPQEDSTGRNREGEPAEARTTAARPPRHPAAGAALPETRFVRSGDVHIAYQVLGEGPVDLVVIGGFVSHLEHIWEQPDYARFRRRLASFSRLIMFDKRGVGLSDRTGYPPSLEDTMDDALAVMEAVDSRQAVLFGVSQGGPNCALLAATYPERVLGLILYGSLAKWIRSPDYPWGVTREQFDRTVGRYAIEWGGPVRLEYFAPSRAEDEEFRQWWARLLRLASSPGGIKEVLEVSRDLDVRHILPTIRAPSLVLHRSGDRIIPLEAGRYLAGLLPGAKFVELPGRDHFWWLGETETVLAEIERFIQGLEPSPPPDRMLATILAAESSEPEAGAPAGPGSDYQRKISREIVRFRGREIEQRGGRLVAAFDGPSRALQCAIALKALARTQRRALRTGLHTGECEVTGGRLAGPAVEIAAGVMAAAQPGQVLVTATLKELLLGTEFTFAEGSHTAPAAAAGDWRLFALDY